MTESVYHPATAEIAARRKQLAPGIHDAFEGFSRAVFADGALPEKTKQLIAVAAAHVTQCPYCIQGHTRLALRSGNSPEEIMEAIWVAAEMRAGGAYAHSTLALHAMQAMHARSPAAAPGRVSRARQAALPARCGVRHPGGQMTSNSFGARDRLTVGDATYEIFRLNRVAGSARLPFSLKVLLENLLRNEDGRMVTAAQIEALAGWDPAAQPSAEIQFTPARVLMQDFTGVPCIVDLAVMREAMAGLGGDPARISPLRPAELVIDHSVIADYFGRPGVLERNIELEYRRNRERYQFLRWGQPRSAGCGWCRRAPGSATRSTSSTWPGWCSPRTAPRSPTPWWAPTRTPRW